MAIPSFPSEDIIEDKSNIQSRATSPSEQQKVVNEAKKYIGVPYVWGGTTPAGFDCSGLVQYVYKNAVGINLPRVTTQQEISGKEVSLNSLSPGDLLFFGNRGATYHVAIYIGNNQYIHAPQPGETIKIASISSYFMPSFARRVLNDSYTEKPIQIPNGKTTVTIEGSIAIITSTLTGTDEQLAAVKKVECPTWSLNDSNNKVWHLAQKINKNTYEARIDLSIYKQYGDYQTDTYVTMSDDRISRISNSYYRYEQ